MYPKLTIKEFDPELAQAMQAESVRKLLLTSSHGGSRQ